MPRILILALLLAVVGCGQPKFCYQQKVEITGGFFRGNSGVVDILVCDEYGSRSYYVRTETVGYRLVSESDLSPQEAGR